MTILLLLPFLLDYYIARLIIKGMVTSQTCTQSASTFDPPFVPMIDLLRAAIPADLRPRLLFGFWLWPRLFLDRVSLLRQTGPDCTLSPIFEDFFLFLHLLVIPWCLTFSVALLDADVYSAVLYFEPMFTRHLTEFMLETDPWCYMMVKCHTTSSTAYSVWALHHLLLRVSRNQG